MARERFGDSAAAPRPNRERTAGALPLMAPLADRRLAASRLRRELEQLVGIDVRDLR